MAEESIDFQNFNKKIIINPVVPLQMIDIYCRNKARVQATILGKVYSSSIEILEIVPDGLVQFNQIKPIDFEQAQQTQYYQRSLENITSVYPTLQILGVAVTDLKADINLAKLHTIYANKNSGFKPQGVLLYPLILSVSTNINQLSKNLDICAYTYNQLFAGFRQLMDVTSFQKLHVQISFGDSDVQGVTPLFQALSDHQQKWLPYQNYKEMIQNLVQNLKLLKEKANSKTFDSLNKKLKIIIDQLNSSHDFSMEDLTYLLQLASLHRKIAVKINKFL